jgi:hypothetical protein
MNDVATIDTTQNDAKANEALALANGLLIQTPEDYKRADVYCRSLFKLRKAIEEDFADSLAKAVAAKRAATEAKAALDEQIESHTKPVHDAEKIIKGKLLQWQRQEDDKRIKEQERLREEERKKAEDKRIKEAEALQAQGKTEQALAAIDKPIKLAAVVLPPAQTERESVISTYLHYTITEAGEVKREYCAPDRGVIQSSINAYKKQGKTIAEIEARIGGIKIEERVK